MRVTIKELHQLLGPRDEPGQAPDRTGIHFHCPVCDAEHWRGFVDGVSLFRCLRCGYAGHGFHGDPTIDREIYADHCAANAINRSLGLSETPLGVDPAEPWRMTMITVTKKAEASYPKRCGKCGTEFRYQLDDLRHNYVRGRDEVSCPGCGSGCVHGDWRRG